MQHTSLNARLTVGHLDAEEKLKGGAMKPFGVTLLILLASLTDVKGDCPDVNGLENMDWEIEGNTLIYTCRHGHNLVPSYLRENYCMADSYWSAPHPVCERVSCGRPPTMNTLGCYGTNDFCPAGGDSEYTSRDYQYGDPVKFICKPGYWISATQLRSTETNCLHDGTWSKPYIECEEIRCQLPDQGDWKNKQKIQDFFDYSYDDPHFSEFDEVIVRCPENTTMVKKRRGEEEGMLNLCQEGGTWEKPFPPCGADCNCSVNTQWRRYGGYRDVTWFDCTAARFRHGEERIVKCSDSRFELQNGFDKMLVKCYDGDLDPKPTCTPKPCSPCVGCKRASKTLHDQTFMGSCRDNYKPSRNTPTCRYGFWKRETSPGVWENEEPCKRVCNRPSNTIIDEDNTDYKLKGEGLNVRCLTGFDLFENVPYEVQNVRQVDQGSHMICEGDDKWSPSYECKKRCSVPWIKMDYVVRTVTEEVIHGNTLHYECAAGYQALHSYGVKCENGEMSLPACNPKPCTECTGCRFYSWARHNHRDKWSVKCKTSFRKTINQVTCKFGDWTNGTTVVEPCTDTCLKPDLSNGNISQPLRFPAAKYSYLDYFCDEGYEKKTFDSRCVDASFSPSPKCEPKPCTVCTGCKFDNWESRDHSDKWSVKCQTSFRNTTNQVTCQLGDWKDEDGKTVAEPCTDQFCSVTRIPGSEEHRETVFLNVTIKIKCKDGRKIMDVSKLGMRKKLNITCKQTSSNGRATTLDPDPTHLACYLSCNMDDITNGQWISGGKRQRREHNEAAQYRCDDDSVAGTDTNVTCDNGTFVPQLKCLLEPCDLTDVDGMRDKTLLELGDQRSVECQNGYKSTVSNVTCEAGKTLSEQTPCVRYCPLQQVENAESHDIDPDIGARVNISCKPGFELSPVSNFAVSTSVLCQNDGTFGEMTIPTCRDPNAPLHDDEGTYCNRTAFADYYVDGEKWNGCRVRPSNNITLECITDGVPYSRMTNNSVICRSNGQWNQNITCKPRSCQCPSGVNYHRCYNGHGQSIYPYCWGGSIRSYCTDGEWQPAVCTYNTPIVRCGCTPPSHYEEIRVGDTVWSNVSKLIAVGEVNITCLHNGTEDLSMRNNTCLPSGKWAEEVQCMKRECKVPEGSTGWFFRDESLKTWMKSGETVSYGHSGYFYCYGHRVLNKCLTGGAWEKQVPTCDGGCAVPEASQVGNPTYTYQGGDQAGDPGTEPVPHRGRIRYRCPGAQGENPITVTCTHGIWDNEIQCQPSSAPSTTPPIPTTVMPIPPVQPTIETQGTSGESCVANHRGAEYQKPNDHRFQPKVKVKDGRSVRWQCLLNPNKGQMQCENGEWNSDSLDNLLEKCP